MKKHSKGKIFLLVCLCLIAGYVSFLMISYYLFDTCECHKYKVYETYTLYPDMTLDKGKDSVCIISSKGKEITTAILK